ncbi:centrosomal protein of 44 kDa isoform X3 [Pitangus sulphuratus]|nr:centrosomal protein of 44 kDa isoform X3 [Pitangus sulphuratus]
MATGDLNGSLRKIEQGLRLLSYPRDVDYTVLVKGDPAAFLPIINYCFTSFSTCIAELLVKCDVELTAKSDLRFIEAVYKFLRDQFQYKPILTKEQFLQFGFAERKMQIVCDIINCVVKKHKELSNSNKIIEDNSEIEFLKSQLADCQEKLHKLDWIEDKLQALEEKLQGKVIIDEKDWNNLLNRVLLLETELLLQSEKRDLPTESSNISRACSSSSIAVSPDTERNEEMPESHLQSSGCSSLLSTNPSPKAMAINSPDLTDISKETIRQRMEKISKMHKYRLGRKWIENSSEKELGVSVDKKLDVSQQRALAAQKAKCTLGCIKRGASKEYSTPVGFHESGVERL